MIAKNATPAERILAALDETAEVENYSASEIEQLPMDVIEQRLDELGVDRTVPPFVRDLPRGDAAPAQQLIDALSEDADEEDEIEHLSLDEVTARLNDSGLNHAAWLERLRKLVGATEASGDNVVPLMRRQPCAVLKAALVKVRWIAAAAAVAAVICNAEYHNVLLHQENVGLKAELQHMNTIAKTKVVMLTTGSSSPLPCR
jgi:hypothetical protein